MTKKTEQEFDPDAVSEELPICALFHLIAENVQHFKQAPDSFVREVAEQMDIITGFCLITDGDGLHLDIRRLREPSANRTDPIT